MLKPIWRMIDATLGRALRHLTFLLVRPYYSLFYNISCSNKHVLQDLPGGLVLATHVSRHDGPMIAALLYSTMRVRPAVLYTEYYHWAQWFPMFLVGAVPMSSPKSWAPERRAKQKDLALGIMRKVISKGNLVLLFPSGGVKRQEREIIKPRLSGAYDIMKSMPECPVVLVRIEGLSTFDSPVYDRFWTFIWIKKGRRHVNVSIELLSSELDTNMPLEQFNERLESLLNNDVEAR